MIRRWVEQHPFSAQQILRRLREQGYAGGYTIVKGYLRLVRPVRPRTYLTLHYAPGECAQIDGGHARNPRRSSPAALELPGRHALLQPPDVRGVHLVPDVGAFPAGLAKRAAVFRRRPCRGILSDNLKTAVLRHSAGQAPVFHERYLDFAAHHGFTPKACGVRQPQAKGRVENNVGYIQKSLLNGLDLIESGRRQHGCPPLAGHRRQWACAWRHPPNSARTLPKRTAPLRPLNSHPYDLGISTPSGSILRSASTSAAIVIPFLLPMPPCG